MNTLTLSSFDTLRYVKTLKAADVPEKQAEAQVEALRDVLEAALADQSTQLATKADVMLARKDAEAAEQRLNARIDALGNQLVIKLSTVMVAMMGVGVAIAKFW